MSYAAALAQEHFRYFVEFGKVPVHVAPASDTPAPASSPAPTGLAASLARSIDDLGLSVRSLNSLKNSSIRTLKELVEQTPKTLDDVKNIGDKAIHEIAEMLQKEKLKFGMKFDEIDGDLRITDHGSLPAIPAASGEEA